MCYTDEKCDSEYDTYALIDSTNEIDFVGKVGFGELIIPDDIEFDYPPNFEVKEKENVNPNKGNTNLNGNYLYGLAKYGQGSGIVKGYLIPLIQSGDIHPALAIPPTDNESNIDFENPFIKRFIVINLFGGVVASDIDRNK